MSLPSDKHQRGNSITPKILRSNGFRAYRVSLHYSIRSRKFPSGLLEVSDSLQGNFLSNEEGIKDINLIFIDSVMLDTGSIESGSPGQRSLPGDLLSDKEGVEDIYYAIRLDIASQEGNVIGVLLGHIQPRVTGSHDRLEGYRHSDVYGGIASQDGYDFSHSGITGLNWRPDDRHCEYASNIIKGRAVKRLKLFWLNFYRSSGAS